MIGGDKASFGRRFGMAAFAGLVFLVGAPGSSARPPQWHYHVTKYGMRQAFVEQKATVLGEHCSTRLQFWGTQDGKDAYGSLGLDFALSPIRSIKGFDFDYFVGEDAPVGDQKLMSVTVFEGGKRFVRSFGVYGLYQYPVENPESHEGYAGITFQTNNLIDDKKGPVRELVDQLLEGADSMEIAVIDGKNHATVLSATFPLAGSKPKLTALLKGL